MLKKSKSVLHKPVRESSSSAVFALAFLMTSLDAQESIMAKRIPTIQRAPDMVSEPDRYFDATLTSDERSRLRKKIMEVSGVGERRWFWGLERPTENEIVRVLSKSNWGDYKDIYTYVLIKLARDLGIDYKSFAKNEPKHSIDGFISLATQTFTDFVVATNSTVERLQSGKLHTLFCDWVDVQCPATGCKKSEHHLWCERFFEPNYAQIGAKIAAAIPYDSLSHASRARPRSSHRASFATRC